MKNLILALAMFFIMLSTGACQSNIEVKPDRDIKIGWDGAGDDVNEYAVFYVQGADTSIFPFVNGTDPYELWNGEPIVNWSFARTYEHEFSFIAKEMPYVTFVRLGVAGINRFTGKLGLISTLPYCIEIKRPANIQGVKEKK